MTTVLLVRHASHGHVGRILTGRSGGVGLSEAGRGEALALARRLGSDRLDAIHASPRERTLETAAVLAETRGIAVDTVEDLDEIDFGSWTGRSFAELEGDPDWRLWNETRSTARLPLGESMGEAQARIVRHLGTVAETFSEGVVALVSHADMIKAAVAHVLGLTLDAIHRFDVDPASVTRLAVGRWGARLQSLNEKA